MTGELERLKQENEDLKEENKKLKYRQYSPDQIDCVCPKCGEKFYINQCRIVASLEHTINDFEKWLGDINKIMEDTPAEDMYQQTEKDGMMALLDLILNKLRELKEENNE